MTDTSSRNIAAEMLNFLDKGTAAHEKYLEDSIYRFPYLRVLCLIPSGAGTMVERFPWFSRNCVLRKNLTAISNIGMTNPLCTWFKFPSDTLNNWNQPDIEVRREPDFGQHRWLNL